MDINFTYDITTPTILCKYMQLYNSEKGSVSGNSKYNYYKVYDKLFKYVKYDKLNIIEFGCINFGSLKAMSDFFLKSIIYGINIHKSDNKNDRIISLYCDYTDKLSIDNLFENTIKSRFDIMIDKWEIFTNNNIYLFENSIKYLNEEGIYIIENIIASEARENVKINELKSKYPNMSFRFEMIQYNLNTHDNCILIIQKNKSDIKHFITFGGPTDDYHKAVIRLCDQAKKCNIFTEINGYTDNDLKNDENFWGKHREFIEGNSRGYGYWIWKPYLILKKLTKMNNNEKLLYLDAGCEIDYTRSDILLKIFNTNKMKLYDDQMQPGCLYITKNELTMSMINEWYKLCCANNYHLLDDSPSKILNTNLIEHRHDQSIFSLLAIKYNVVNNDLIPTIASSFNCVNSWPIKIIRNITGISKIHNINKEQTYWNNHLNDKMYTDTFKKWVGDCDALSKKYLYEYLKNKDHKNILDVGCADGSICDGIIKYNINIKYTGVDSCKYFVNKCNEKNINVIESDIRNIILPDSSFDLVYGRHVLEHQNNFENLLNEMIRISRIEVIHTFFIIPSVTDNADKFNYTPDTNLYHNIYSYNNISNFLNNHNKVKSFKHELILNTNESILHILIK